MIKGLLVRVGNMVVKSVSGTDILKEEQKKELEKSTECIIEMMDTLLDQADPENIGRNSKKKSKGSKRRTRVSKEDSNNPREINVNVREIKIRQRKSAGSALVTVMAILSIAAISIAATLSDGIKRYADAINDSSDYGGLDPALEMEV